MSKYLKFDKLRRPEGKATDTWRIWPRASSFLLGVVKWHAPWRRYVFEPNGQTLFDADCLCELQAFMRERTLEQQEDARARREARRAA